MHGTRCALSLGFLCVVVSSYVASQLGDERHFTSVPEGQVSIARAYHAGLGEDWRQASGAGRVFFFVCRGLSPRFEDPSVIPILRGLLFSAERSAASSPNSSGESDPGPSSVFWRAFLTFRFVFTWFCFPVCILLASVAVPVVYGCFNFSSRARVLSVSWREFPSLIHGNFSRLNTWLC